MTPVQQIKQHALDNYNNGWDYIVECYTDEEIQTEYLDAAGGDVTKAMALIQEVADYRNERSEEARRAVEENTDTEEEKPMTKRVNYGLNETIEGSYQTLSDAVTMYAIYYNDWTEATTKLNEFYNSARWNDEEVDFYCDEHVFLVQERNRALRNVQEVGERLRSVGIMVDLAEWATVDEKFDEFDLDADRY